MPSGCRRRGSHLYLLRFLTSFSYEGRGNRIALASLCCLGQEGNETGDHPKDSSLITYSLYTITETQNTISHISHQTSSTPSLNKPSTILKNLSRYSVESVVILIGPFLAKKLKLLINPVINLACVLCFAQKKSNTTARYTHFPSVDSMPDRHGDALAVIVDTEDLEEAG